MSAIFRLTTFLTRTLFRTLMGAVPPLLTLTFFWTTFYLFPFDMGYLVAVGGLEMSLVCIVTMFLLTDLVNRAASYPIVLRLQRRSHLIVALILCSVVITSVLSFLFVGAALLRHGVTPSNIQLTHLAIRWLIIFLLSAIITLHVSQLVSRYYSHLWMYLALGVILSINDQKRHLIRRNLDEVVTWNTRLIEPVTLMFSGSTEVPLALYLQPIGITSLYILGLCLLASWLFRRKDLIWME